MTTKWVIFLSLAIGLFLLTACPMGTKYPLGPRSQFPMDQRLLGTWENDTLPEARKVTIYASSSKDFYELRIDELGPVYLLSERIYEVWITTIGGMNFIVLRSYGEGFDGLIFYAYHYYFRKEALVMHEFNTGIFEFESVGAYRGAVTTAMTRKDFLLPPCRWTKSR
jgi:hypothetical protein